MNEPSELRARTRRSGSRLIPSPPEDVFPLLTPEGEREWVDGWAPHYPALVEPEDLPGTAFTTSHHGHEAVWLIAEKDDVRRAATYAYVIPGVRATLVRVSCVEEAGQTRATITYDMTALSSEHDAEVRAFDAGFDDMLDHWRDTLTTVLAGA